MISNIKMRDFRKGRHAVVDNTHVMKVRIHKTHRKHGDANIIIDEALWRWLSIYKEKGWPLTPNFSETMEGDDSPFFLSAVSTEMTKVGQSLKRRGEAPGINDPNKMLPTNIRKTVVTMGHKDMSPKRRERLANFMCHSVPVQEGYDRARHKVARNIAASFDVAKLVTLEPGHDVPSASRSDLILNTVVQCSRTTKRIDSHRGDASITCFVC